VAAERTRRLFGSRAVLYLSTHPKKKYQLETPSGWRYFGQMGWEDYLKHKDPRRRHLYITRASALPGNWKKDLFSPNNLAQKILW
jgi:hypothetical protein